MLEEEVDEKYFLSEDRVEKMQIYPYNINLYVHEDGSGNIRSITAHESSGTSCVEVCRTIRTCGGGGKPMIEHEKRVRILTERELFRLMGFSDDDFDKASKVNSSTQLKKQAGNSIVVPVLEAIFKQILED